MNFRELLPSYNKHKSDTEAALEASNKKISDLTAKLEALEAANKIQADDADKTADESSEIDSLISDLQDVLNKYKSDESTDDSSDSSDDSTDDSTSDDSDDANDETAKASKVEKLKGLTKQAAKVVAEAKQVKASIPQQVIREIAAVGIPTPIATKPDAKPSDLKGLERVAAAFTEQLTKK